MQIAIAMNPSTSEEILLSMLEYGCDHVSEAIASNENASQKIIEQLLMANKEEKVEKKIYSLVLENNRTIPHKLIDKVTKDRDLMCSLMSNKNLDLKILDKISNLTKEKIEVNSWRLASSINTPKDILVKLSQDNDFYVGDYVRYLVAINPHTPTILAIEILEQFLDKEDGINFRTIEAYLKINPLKKSLIVERYLKNSSSNIVHLILSFHPYVSKINFMQYSKSLDWLERYAIAQNYNTPVDVLHKLASDANKIVRAAAKDNLAKKEKAKV